MFSGRTLYQQKFKSWQEADKSDFVVVYGRRRVGKTHLIRETFNNQFSFYTTGLANTDMAGQLQNFHYALQDFGSKLEEAPETWMAAFRELEQVLKRDKRKKKVVFIDELPWLDTPRSQFLPALEHFWNHWASARKDILLIACGSAASWMINKLLNNTGGLHNRVTQQIHLKPFTLFECEEFFKKKGIVLDRYQIIELYMAFGGIPFYLEAINKGESATQSIDRLCFGENARFKNEFNNLFASLFKKSDSHIAIVQALSKKSKGLTRSEVSKISGILSGGTLSKCLNELGSSGFIRVYTPFQKKKRDSLYQLTDPFSLFHQEFMASKDALEAGYWSTVLDTPKQRSWAGFAFERVCLAHINQIKRALGISGILTSVSSWRSSQSKNGAQIDLLIERRDRVINICEMKFSINPFTISKAYLQNLRNKIGTFRAETNTKMAVHLVMITTFGVTQNEHTSLVQHSIDMDALFQDET